MGAAFLPTQCDHGKSDRAIDEEVKEEHHAPTIGKLLCETKNAALSLFCVQAMRYTLKNWDGLT